MGKQYKTKEIFRELVRVYAEKFYPQYADKSNQIWDATIEELEANPDIGLEGLTKKMAEKFQ